MKARNQVVCMHTLNWRQNAIDDAADWLRSTYDHATLYHTAGAWATSGCAVWAVIFVHCATI